MNKWKAAVDLVGALIAHVAGMIFWLLFFVGVGTSLPPLNRLSSTDPLTGYSTSVPSCCGAPSASCSSCGGGRAVARCGLIQFSGPLPLPGRSLL